MVQADPREPIFDVAQVANVEVVAPDPAGTWFSSKMLRGLREIERQNSSAHLHAYDVFYYHTQGWIDGDTGLTLEGPDHNPSSDAAAQVPPAGNSVQDYVNVH